MSLKPRVAAASSQISGAKTSQAVDVGRLLHKPYNQSAVDISAVAKQLDMCVEGVGVVPLNGNI